MIYIIVNTLGMVYTKIVKCYTDRNLTNAITTYHNTCTYTISMHTHRDILMDSSVVFTYAKLRYTAERRLGEYSRSLIVFHDGKSTTFTQREPTTVVQMAFGKHHLKW